MSDRRGGKGSGGGSPKRLAFSEFAHLDHDDKAFAKNLGNSVNDVSNVQAPVPRGSSSEPRKERPSSIAMSGPVDDGDTDASAAGEGCKRPDCQTLGYEIGRRQHENATERARIEADIMEHMDTLQSWEDELNRFDEITDSLTAEQNTLSEQLRSTKARYETLESLVKQNEREKEELSSKLMILETERQNWMQALNEAEKAYTSMMWYGEATAPRMTTPGDRSLNPIVFSPMKKGRKRAAQAKRAGASSTQAYKPLVRDDVLDPSERSLVEPDPVYMPLRADEHAEQAAKERHQQQGSRRLGLTEDAASASGLFTLPGDRSSLGGGRLLHESPTMGGSTASLSLGEPHRHHHHHDQHSHHNGNGHARGGAGQHHHHHHHHHHQHQHQHQHQHRPHNQQQEFVVGAIQQRPHTSHVPGSSSSPNFHRQPHPRAHPHHRSGSVPPHDAQGGHQSLWSSSSVTTLPSFETGGYSSTSPMSLWGDTTMYGTPNPREYLGDAYRVRPGSQRKQSRKDNFVPGRVLPPKTAPPTLVAVTGPGSGILRC